MEQMWGRREKKIKFLNQKHFQEDLGAGHANNQIKRIVITKLRKWMMKRTRKLTQKTASSHSSALGHTVGFLVMKAILDKQKHLPRRQKNLMGVIKR